MLKIYYRKSLIDDNELKSLSFNFESTYLLSNINKGDFVIPRYSLYPFVLDLCKEIENIGAKLINSYEQLIYISDIKNYIIDLKELTPETWLNIEDAPDNCQFVLKGETNSKKQNWNKSMFAKNKKEAIEIYGRLCEDSLIGYQKIYIRKYIPLVQYLTGIGGIPVTKEFRFFIAFGKIISGAYYWQNYADDIDLIPSIDEVPKSFLNKVISRIGNKNNFYVIDVAQAQSGEWIVIELNQGEQSGLSMNNPNILYKNLKESIVNQ